MKGGRTESGLMDREIGMVDAFSDEDNEKPVCLQFQEMSGSPENQNLRGYENGV